VNGDVDEAVLTSLFGLDHGHSEDSERLRERVAELESHVIQGTASDAQKAELQAITLRLPATSSALIDQTLRKIRGLT